MGCPLVEQEGALQLRDGAASKLLAHIAAERFARGSNLAGCSSIIGDNAGDGTTPDGRSEPRTSLPSWQREPSLPSRTLPSPQ